MKTVDAARGKWRGILIHFGMDARYLQNKHMDCPLCGGKDRFRFDDKDGNGTYFCNACGAGDGPKLAMEFTGKEFKEMAQEIDQFVGNIPVTTHSQQSKKDPSGTLRKIQAGLLAVSKDDPVERYLSGRGLELPETGISYHPQMAYFNEDRKFTGFHPAMVATFRNKNLRPITYHVTYLTENGEKAALDANKKIMPPIEPMSGGAIALSKPCKVLGIAEGIETAIAAGQLYGMSVWSATGTTLLESWQPPRQTTEVHVFADNDENYAGHAAAYRLAHRLVVRNHLQVHMHVPPYTGEDWNDVLKNKFPELMKGAA